MYFCQHHFCVALVLGTAQRNYADLYSFVHLLLPFFSGLRVRYEAEPRKFLPFLFKFCIFSYKRNRLLNILIAIAPSCQSGHDLLHFLHALIAVS